MYVKAAIIVVFVIPIIAASLLFVIKADAMRMDDKAIAYARARARREARRAMMREAARRRVRGTPRRRAV